MPSLCLAPRTLAPSPQSHNHHHIPQPPAADGIGKERILTAVHDRCGLRLHVADRKHGVMQQLDLPGAGWHS